MSNSSTRLRIPRTENKRPRQWAVDGLQRQLGRASAFLADQVEHFLDQDAHGAGGRLRPACDDRVGNFLVVGNTGRAYALAPVADTDAEAQTASRNTLRLAPY